VTARGIAAKLVPLGCVGKPVPAADINEVGGIKPKVQLSCTINGESITIDQYRNAQQVAYNDRMLKGVGCTILKGFGITDVSFVTDGATTTQAATTRTAQQIHHRLGHGASIMSVHCK
jgi:hypothetical protein